MTRKPRREPEPGEFQDPLKNYTAEPHSDDLERSLAEDPLRVIEYKPVVTIGPEETVRGAIRRMAELGIASLVVCEAGRPIGILTEYDVLVRVAERFDAIADQPVRSVMTPDPVVVFDSEPPARVVNLMANGPFRHLPVVDVDGKLVGVIGPRRVTAYLQRFFRDLDAA
jgi:CBS domain-containing protein